MRRESPYCVLSMGIFNDLSRLSNILLGVAGIAVYPSDIVLLVLVDDPGAIMVSHALGHYSALIVERRRAATFREEALHDELTGCYNRKILPVRVDLVRVAQRNIRADEFFLVLRGCPLEVASTIADHLVSDCRQSGVAAVQDASAANGAPRVVGYTVSAGVAFCCGGEPSLEEVTATLQMADRGLYKAKNQGKGGWCAG